ncbi:LytR C-terminal domain-containing protein [Sinomonas halotolerans]|uniref:LytR C-terminal domain-containing protein n=1 Tax=Sinomonas halotolerans TaxID=1644133 RepID=A0ABU9WVZ3_9MICC
MSTYPRDEFDAVPESPRRQGVHRARANGGGRRGLVWILAAGIAALLIGALAFFVLPGLVGAQKTAPASSSAPSSAAPTPPAESSAPATAAPTKEAAPTPTPTPTQAGPTVDRTLEVGVYNATGTAGLGARVGDTARAAGWNVTAVANWGGSPVASPVVYYRDAKDAAAARALAADLGISEVYEASALGIPLAAVLGPGYAG